MCAFCERDRTIEVQILVDERIIMIPNGLIFDDRRNSGNAKIGLSTAGTRQIDTRSTWLIIDDVITDSLSYVVQIRTRKMILSLRQILISWSYLGREDCLGHRICGTPKLAAI